MLLIKIISALFGLLGVTELATQVKYNKSSISVLSDLSAGLFQKLNDHFSQKRGLPPAPVDDEVEHRRWWNYKDEEHEDDNRRVHFHEAMQHKMKDVKACHKECGWDVACHKACPKPWAKFQEKCEVLKPIWVCHEECRRSRGGHSCHSQCPKPQCPKLARKMEETMQCHQKCGQGGFMCHQACPSPMAHIVSKCTALQDIIGCHGKCSPGDHLCHHACPKVWSLWHLDRKPSGEDSEEDSAFHKGMLLIEAKKCLNGCGWGDHDCFYACAQPRQKFQDMKDAHHFHHYDHHDHSPEEDDEVRHQKWWGYNAEEHHIDHRSNFHKVMGEKMHEVKECHKRCGWDVACHQACPKPWKHFQEKCDKFKPFFECHQQCHGHRDPQSCNAECPRPHCPKMAQKFAANVFKCHRNCGHDKLVTDHHKCHASCSHKLVHIQQKCDTLQHVTECHQKCGPMDIKCHGSCMRMHDLWHLSGGQQLATVHV